MLVFTFETSCPNWKNKNSVANVEINGYLYLSYWEVNEHFV